MNLEEEAHLLMMVMVLCLLAELYIAKKKNSHCTAFYFLSSLLHFTMKPLGFTYVQMHLLLKCVI